MIANAIRWARRRAQHLLIIARYDSTAFAELASGLFLILLRAVLLLLAPKQFWPYDVADPLRALGLDETRWGALLLVLGSAQIVLAGSAHHLLRLLAVVAIMVAFVVVAVAYGVSGFMFSQAVLGIACVIAFYLGLLVRILHDRHDQRETAP